MDIDDIIDDPKTRRQNAENFDKYIEETGISAAFQMIFTEIITKSLPAEDQFSYAVSRLKQMDRDLANMKNKKKS